MIPPVGTSKADQAILDIDQVRVLPMSHKYNPSALHVALLIYSVDGQTDFVLNDAMMRIKTGDILIHQTHHALTGQEELYRELIRTLFGTHRINLIGLVFTFSGTGQISECMRWGPTSPSHTSPAHPTEQKLLEIVLVSLYMNNRWLSMPVATHIDVETLSQTAKKQYLLKLSEIESAFNKRRAERQQQAYGPLGNLLKLPSHHHHSSDNFQSFEWTPNREQTFDGAMQGLLDTFYNLIEDTLPEGEFDRDQYAYYDDNTKQLAANLVQPYVPTPITPAQNYAYLPRNNFLYR